MDWRRNLYVALVFASGLAAHAPAARTQSGGGYDLTWSSLDCGSSTASYGGSYSLGGTIGQADASSATGGSYSMQGGFLLSSLTPTDVPPPELAGGAGALVFRLQGNTPNPFRSATAIAFSLARNENVSMRIYDLAGRLVRTVLSQPLGPGRHQVMWNARDDDGRRVAHGIYVLRLEAGSFQARRKLVLVP